MKKVFNKTMKGAISLSIILLLMFGTVSPGLSNRVWQNVGITGAFAIDAEATFMFTNTEGVNILDGDIATYENYIGDVTWIGDLSKKTISISMSSGSTNSSVQPWIEFMNVNNQPISFMKAATNTFVNRYTFPQNVTTANISVPDGTVKIKVGGSTLANSRLHSVALVQSPTALENVMLTPGYNDITVDFTKQSDVSEVAAYVDGVYHGRYTGSTIKLNYLLSKQSYIIDLIPFTADANPGPITQYNVSTLDNGVNFRFSAKTDTTGFKMLDEDNATYVSYNGKVTWDGDLTGEVFKVTGSTRYYGSSFQFKDASGKVLSFVDADTHQVVTAATFGKSEISTKRLIVPEGAVYSEVSSSSESLYFRGISIERKAKPTALENVRITPFYNDLTVNFTKQSDVHKVAAYVNGIYYGSYTESTFKLTALLSKQSYSITLIPFTVDATPGPDTQYTVSTLDNGINFRFSAKTDTIGFKMLDEDNATYVSYNGKVTWDGDLTGEVFKVTGSTRYYGSSFQFKDASGKVLSFIDADTHQVLTSASFGTALLTKQLIVPEGTAYAEISSGSESLYFRGISVVGVAVDVEQAILLATNAVEIAEASKLQKDIDNAIIKVNSLPDSIEKTDLKNRLDVVQLLIDDANAKAFAISEATAEVVKAETSKAQSDIDAARTLVIALHEGEDKNSLISRLNALQLALNDELALQIATAAIEKAELTKSETDVNIAKDLVAAISNSQIKDALTNRLDAIKVIPVVVSQEYKMADTKINLAMSLPREPYLSLALLAIEKVSDPVEKAALVAEMQIAIEKSTASKPMTTKTANLFVRLAEITGRDKYIVLAEEKALQIVDEVEKQDAITRMDLTKLVKSPAEKRAYSALIAAEQWKSTNMITAATKIINALTEGSLKTTMLSRITEIK